MTIARTPSGEIVGQVCAMRDRAPNDRLCKTTICLLTRDGRYVTVPRSSVRLEEFR